MEGSKQKNALATDQTKECPRNRQKKNQIVIEPLPSNCDDGINGHPKKHESTTIPLTSGIKTLVIDPSCIRANQDGNFYTKDGQSQWVYLVAMEGQDGRHTLL